MELVVVMFILSVLTFFTLPVFEKSGIGRNTDTRDGKDLVQFISAVRQKAVRDQRDYILHLDLISGMAWADLSPRDNGNEKKETESNQGRESGINGLSLSRIDFVHQAGQEPENTRIQISHKGTCDMALIHMETEDGQITLKLHPFINTVEIIQGDISFHDCP